MTNLNTHLQVFETRLANVIFLCKHDGGGLDDVYALQVQKETCIKIQNSFMSPTFVRRQTIAHHLPVMRVKK